MIGNENPQKENKIAFFTQFQRFSFHNDFSSFTTSIATYGVYGKI
jgi:hypothetical protein